MSDVANYNPEPRCILSPFRSIRLALKALRYPPLFFARARANNSGNIKMVGDFEEEHLYENCFRMLNKMANQMLNLLTATID